MKAAIALFAASFLTCTACAADSDNDGVPDEWKKDGSVMITLPSGERQKLDLTRDGAPAKGRKDVFVWIAWMQDGKHSHKPDPKAIAIVRESFARAPVKNRDGTTGIRLHVFYGDKPLQEMPVLGGAAPDGDYDWAAFDKIKNDTLPKELARVFHFCIFAHDIDTDHHSGMSKGIGAYDFIVSLGAFDEDGKPAGVFSQAGTFMHELGHNLGLQHGGGDDVNYKPNYISVMNYLFQLNGIFLDYKPSFDYSRFDLPADETALDKEHGLTADTDRVRYGTQYYCSRKPDFSHSADSLGGPVDWDCSGDVKGVVSEDINADGSRGTLAGFDDWSHLVLKPSGVAGLAKPRPKPRLKDELTLKKANDIPLRTPSRVSASLEGEVVILHWRPVPSERVVGYEINKVADKGEHVSIAVVDARANTFVDKAAGRGKLGYSVRAIYRPFGNLALLQKSNALAGHPQVVTASHFLELGRLSQAFVLSAMKGLPELPPKTPPPLLKTAYSSVTTVEVR